MRLFVKNNDTHSIKSKVLQGMWLVDDPLDVYAKHTLMHDAVMMDREELLTFLIGNGANPMVRD